MAFNVWWETYGLTDLIAKQAELSLGKIASIWVFQVMEWLIINPRNFIWLALVINLLSKLIIVSKLVWFLLWNWRKLVLLIFSDSEFSRNHLVNCWKDDEIVFWNSWLLGLVIIMLVSSANSIGTVLVGTAVGKSLMYNKKNKGPNTKPCGTPWLILVHPETTLEFVWNF